MCEDQRSNADRRDEIPPKVSNITCVFAVGVEIVGSE